MTNFRAEGYGRGSEKRLGVLPVYRLPDHRLRILLRRFIGRCLFDRPLFQFFALDILRRHHVLHRAAPAEMSAVDDHAVGIAKFHFVESVGASSSGRPLEIFAARGFNFLFGFDNVIYPEAHVVDALIVLAAFVLTLHVTCPFIRFIGE